MRKKMNKANIINNIPHCKCGAPVGGIVDYNGAMVNDKSYTRFVRRCSVPTCNNISIYYTDARIEYTTREVFDESEVTIIKEK